MFDTTFIIALLAVAVVSYLLGSISFAVIVSRVFAKDDVRKHGSGNAGMTNILRTYGKGPAAVTAAGDFAKAIASIFFARWLFNMMGIDALDAGNIAGLFVILGHVYPLYFGFKGGKGVMTTLGVILAVNPAVFLIVAIIFIPLVLVTKIVSLGSVLGATAYPVITYVTAYLWHRPAFYSTLFAAVYAVIILIMHRQNIKRLINGTEHKFGSKK